MKISKKYDRKEDDKMIRWEKKKEKIQGKRKKTRKNKQ